jgi:MtN3 and saliva related transmembrane protein
MSHFVCGLFLWDLMAHYFWNMCNLISSKHIWRSRILDYRSNIAESGREMDYINIIGLVAAAMGGISLFPQLLKVLKTKSTKDISLGMISIFSGSIFLWLVYGILLKNSPIIIANFFGFIQALIILLYKIKYK